MPTRRPPGAGVVASLLILVLLSAVFMSGLAFSHETDTTNRVIAIGIFIPLAVSTVVFAIALYRALFAQRIARKRWNRINGELYGMGFRDAGAREVDETLGFPVNLLAPDTLALQRGGGIDHVTVGEIGGREVRCFNVRIRGSAWLDVPAAALRVDARLASTVIRPSRSPLPPRLDMKRATFEHEPFNRSVGVFSVDLFFASALVDARMMEWLLAHLDGAVIELADRWVVAWGIRHRFRDRRPLEMLDVLVRFGEQVPRVVPAFFPEDDFLTFWRHRRRTFAGPIGEVRKRFTLRPRSVPGPSGAPGRSRTSDPFA